jgi:hypothetical protein
LEAAGDYHARRQQLEEQERAREAAPQPLVSIRFLFFLPGQVG